MTMSSKMSTNAQAGASSLSAIAELYARSLADPFDGPMARIPDTPTINTSLRRYFARGTFVTSSDPASLGQGYIWASPPRGVVNDLSAVEYNNSNSPTVQANGFSSTNAQNIFTNSEFASTLLPLGFQYRVVSAGLRIRYAGNQLTRGGQLAGLHEPSHTALAGLRGVDLLGYREGSQESISDSDGWWTLLYRQVDKQDSDFTQTIPAGFNVPDGGYLGFWINSYDQTGAAGSQLFEYEFCGNYEILGSNISGKQPSHSDSVGHTAVVSVVSSSNSFLKVHTQHPPSLGTALVHASSDYVDHHSSHSDMHKKKKKKKQSGGTPWYHSLLDLIPGAIGGLISLL